MGHKFKATKSSGEGTYYGVSVRYLQSYLQEFCFRFIRREKENAIHDSLLRACVFALPMTYAELK